MSVSRDRFLALDFITTLDRTLRSGDGLSLTQSRRDYGRDTVTAHADSVQGISDLHGALLMSDDEQLTRRPQLFIDLQQAAKICVVESGLNFVKDVKGAGPRDEQRNQKAHRHQGAFATGQQRF